MKEKRVPSVALAHGSEPCADPRFPVRSTLTFVFPRVYEPLLLGFQIQVAPIRGIVTAEEDILP